MNTRTQVDLKAARAEAAALELACNVDVKEGLFFITMATGETEPAAGLPRALEIIRAYAALARAKQLPERIVQVREDLHNPRPGYFRAFWCDSPTDTTGSPVIGYASPGGSHRTIKATVMELFRIHPSTHVYRNGRRIA